MLYVIYIIYNFVISTQKFIFKKFTLPKYRFQASGDHIPAPPPTPPAPAVPLNSKQNTYNNANYGDDGSYDPRYNDPNFSLNHNQNQPAAKPNIGNIQYNQPSYQQPSQPNYQPSQPSYQPSQPSHQPSQPIYQHTYQQPTYSTTTHTPRIYPPGKLSLNRTPDGFSYSFNKI